MSPPTTTCTNVCLFTNTARSPQAPQASNSLCWLEYIAHYVTKTDWRDARVFIAKLLRARYYQRRGKQTVALTSYRSRTKNVPFVCKHVSLCSNYVRRHCLRRNSLIINANVKKIVLKHKSKMFNILQLVPYYRNLKHANNIDYPDFIGRNVDIVFCRDTWDS